MTLRFHTVLERFGSMGEKTGWTYIPLPAEKARQLHPQDKKSFPVRANLDQLKNISLTALPMGEGDYIVAIQAELLRKLRKKAGDSIQVHLAPDTPYSLNPILIECLKEEPAAYAFFQTFAPGHQNYFSKWMESAKTESTQAKRIAQIIRAMLNKQNYAEMIRSSKENK